MYIAKRRMWVLPAVAVAVLLVASALFGFSSAAYAQTAAGDYCVEGIVIDWEEQPMAGIEVKLVTPLGEEPTDTTDDGDDEGEFEFDSKDGDFAGAPGVYTATVNLDLLNQNEDPRSPWEGVTPDEINFEIEPNTKGCVQIRFKLRQIVPVTVYKIDASHNPLPNWTIDVVPGGGNLFAEPQSEETGPDGSVTFTVTPGVYIFMERQPDSDDDDVRPDMYQPVAPRTGRTELDVQPFLDEDDPEYLVVFKNEFKDNGCISVRKFGLCEEGREEGRACGDINNPRAGGYGVAGWGFALERSDGTIARQGVTDAEGYLTFDNLPYGPYTIVEEEVPGWGFVEGFPEARDVIVNSGQCLLIGFINEQDDSGFCIEGYKRDANGNYGIPKWEIEVDPVDDGGWDPDDDPDFEGYFTDGVGKYRIDFPADDYRIPGSEFEICEDDDVDGWLPHTPVCQIVKLPVKPGKCVQALDFVNQQVGHSEYEQMKAKQDAMAEHKKDTWDGGKMDGGNMPDMNGGSMWVDGKDGGKGSGMYCSDYHSVKAGEGLFDIGVDYGKSAQQMVNANPDVKAPNYTILVGQKICIP